MTQLTQSERNARWRQKRRRVTLFLTPGEPADVALTKLQASHPNAPAAIKAALVGAIRR